MISINNLHSIIITAITIICILTFMDNATRVLSTPDRWVESVIRIVGIGIVVWISYALMMKYL